MDQVASKGRKELNKLVSEFGERSEVNYPKEVQQDLAIAKQYKALLKSSDSDNESYNNIISSEAEKIKSIKMDLAEGVSLDFKIPAGSSKQGKNSGSDEVIRDAKNSTLGSRRSNDSAMPNKGKGVEIEGLDRYLGKKGMSITRRS